MMERGIFGGQFSEAAGRPARLRQKSSVWLARGPVRFALLAISGVCVLLGSTRSVRAATCPTNAVEIGAPQQFVWSALDQSNIALITYMTMGRRSLSLYTLTKYGSIGAYLGSNPSDPTPTLDSVSFRAKGPVGGGTGQDCWPGPTSLALADTASGAGRLAMGWPIGCGDAAQVLITTPPGGQSTYGQQIDVNGNGTGVFAGTVASAVTSSGKYAGYFSDGKGAYVIDLSNPSGSAGSTPLSPIQTISSWAGANYLFTLGGSSSTSFDQYVAAVFLASKTVQIASIASDGRLTVLSTSASISGGGAPGSNEQKTAIYPNGNGFYLFVADAAGIDVFSFDGAHLSKLGTIPHADPNDEYTLLQVPSQAPGAVLFAERLASHQIDVFAGGFIAGQSGAPSLMTSIPVLSNDNGSGFGAYISSTDRNTAYIYRIISVTSGLGLQTDTFDITCVASPPTPNPSASFTLVNKSAQGRADQNNYVGDTFSVTDGSLAGTGGAITNWYLWPTYSASTSTKANAALPNTSAPAYANLVLPCTGGISSGQCGYALQDIGGAAVNETFGELVSAGNLDSTVFTRSISLTVPTTKIVGQNIDKSVKLLSGSGQLDASSSTGSPTAFTWSFTDSQNASLTTACAAAKCTPPSNAHGFSVAADYAGGYQANFVTGTIVFTDVAGSITVPSTVYASQGSIPVTIALQKGGSVLVSSITESIDGGASSALSVTLAGNSGGSNSVTGSTTVPIPAGLTTGQGHSIAFVVNYTGGNLGTNVTFTDPFLFSTVAYQPSISISTHNSAPPDNNAFNPFGNVYSLIPNATYYFGDMADYALPGVTADWDFGDGNQSSSTTSSIVTHAFSGSGNKTVHLTVQGVATSVTVSLTGTPPPPFSVGSIQGPGSVTPGGAGNYSANISGGTPPYSYSWASSDGGSSLSSTFPHTFNNAGTFNVSLTAHDSAGHSKTVSKNVTVATGGCTSGCGGGPTDIVVGGPSSIVLPGGAGSWTASVSGVSSSSLSISWLLTGGGLHVTGLGTTFSYTFTAAGSYTLTASGNEIVGAAPIPLNPGSKTINVTGVVGPPPPSAAFAVVGATYTQYANPQYSAKAGDVVTFQGSETKDSPVFAWDFGDSTTGAGASVTHAFSQKGTYTVKLTVTNGHQLSAETTTKIGITGQAFSALFIPGAGHLTTDGGGAVATGVSIFNGSANPLTIDLDFEKTNPAVSIDPSKLAYPDAGKITIPPHGGWTSTDVTSGFLGAGPDDFGTLFIKYTGATPSVLARIYFSQGGPGDPTYGTYLPAYSTNGGGVSLGGVSAGPQNLVGLKYDDDFKFSITLVSASQSGGNFNIQLFRDDGTQVGSTLPYTISGFQQVKLGPETFGAPPVPGHIYYAVVSSPGSAPAPVIAVGTVVDRRSKDSLLLIDDTPRLATPPGSSALYYVAGAGRTTSGAKTDLYLLNTSNYGIGSLNFRFHYVDETGEHTAQVPQLLFAGAHQAIQISDVITTLFPTITGQVLGDLRIDYQVPNDNAPLIIEARNYSDPGTGSYGMQLPAYAASDGLVPGSTSRIVIAGLHNDFDPLAQVAACSDVAVGASVEVAGTAGDNGSIAASQVTLDSPGAHGTNVFGTVASIDCTGGTMTLTTATGSVNVTFAGTTGFAHGAYDNISRFGFVALGDTPVRAHVDAYDQTDGSLFWSGDYDLNGATFGHFVYQPTTGPGTDAFTQHPAYNIVISAPAISDTGNTPVAAFATIQDVHSNDLVFIPGKKPASAQ